MLHEKEGAFLTFYTGQMLPGPYRLPAVSYRARSYATNRTPTAAYRGAGRPEATALLERAMDLLACELQLDPAELRHRNLRGIYMRVLEGGRIAPGASVEVLSRPPVDV